MQKELEVSDFFQKHEVSIAYLSLFCEDYDGANIITALRYNWKNNPIWKINI